MDRLHYPFALQEPALLVTGTPYIRRFWNHSTVYIVDVGFVSAAQEASGHHVQDESGVATPVVCCGPTDGNPYLVDTNEHMNTYWTHPFLIP